ERTGLPAGHDAPPARALAGRGGGPGPGRRRPPGLRARLGGPRAPAVRQPGLRRRRPAGLGSRALLRGPPLLPEPRARPSVPDASLNPELVRPSRVGMACAFCHVGPDPVHPPEDPERPRWENLSAYVGNQYFRVGRIFLHDLGPDNFVWQLFNSAAPGALDTSLIATDNINNPRTMNGIYEVGTRLQIAVPEEIRGGGLELTGGQPRVPLPHLLKHLAH